MCSRICSMHANVFSSVFHTCVCLVSMYACLVVCLLPMWTCSTNVNVFYECERVLRMCSTHVYALYECMDVLSYECVCVWMSCRMNVFVYGCLVVWMCLCMDVLSYECVCVWMSCRMPSTNVNVFYECELVLRMWTCSRMCCMHVYALYERMNVFSCSTNVILFSNVNLFYECERVLRMWTCSRICSMHVYALYERMNVFSNMYCKCFYIVCCMNVFYMYECVHSCVYPHVWMYSYVWVYSYVWMYSYVWIYACPST